MKNKYLIFDLDGTLIDAHNSNAKIFKDFIVKNEPKYIENADYALKNINNFKNPRHGLLTIFDGNEELTEKYHQEISILLDEASQNYGISGNVLEMIKRLSKAEFTLFLSTGSNDEYAKKVLKSGGVYTLFDAVMGSTTLVKGPQHIETFEMVSDDKNFYQKTVFIGDGAGDRAIAKEAGIPFIKVGKQGEDRYEIDSILEVEELIKRVR